MSKTTRNILIAIVIILLIFGIVFAIYNNFKTEPISANTTNNNILDDSNTGLENFINDILEDNENTQNKENNVNMPGNNTSTQVSNTQTSGQNTNTADNNSVENQTTPGEKKAIELAKAEWKKEWGNIDDVSFNNVMIQGDGKYIVSVNDSKTTKVIRRYIVDTATGLVEEQ